MATIAMMAMGGREQDAGGGGLEGKSGGEVRRGEVRGGWGEEGMRV